MNKEIQEYIKKYPDIIIQLFNTIYDKLVLFTEINNLSLEEKMWAKLPSFYIKDKFVRLIPFKDHINIEAKSIKEMEVEIKDYKLTPTGMLQIFKNQIIPLDLINRIFVNTFLDKEKSIDEMLMDSKYDEYKEEEKLFVRLFTNKMDDLGYTFNNQIVDGICYGKYMMIFTKKNVKSKKVYARFYFRTQGIVLRLFFNDISKHSEYIIQTPDYIKNTFISDYAKCNHCRGDNCKFRKSYIINDITYEKCNGLTFEFFNLKVDNLEEYINLFKEFYSK